MPHSLIRMRDASAVFALCVGSAALLSIPFGVLGPYFLAFGWCVAALLAACLAPTFDWLWRKPNPSASIVSLLCGAGIGLVSLMTIVVCTRNWPQFSQLSEAVAGYPWSVRLELWVGLLLPEAWWLFVIAGAFAAWLFRRVSCTQAA